MGTAMGIPKLAQIEIPVRLAGVLREMGMDYIEANTVRFDGEPADCRQCHADLMDHETGHDPDCPVWLMSEFLSAL